MKNVHFVEQGLRLQGYAFFYLDAAHANHKFVGQFIQKHYGAKVDQESSLIFIEKGNPEKIYVGLKVDHTLSMASHEDKIEQVSSHSPLALPLPLFLSLCPPCGSLSPLLLSPFFLSFFSLVFFIA